MRRRRLPPRWGRGNYCHASSSPVYHNAPLAMYHTFAAFVHKVLCSMGESGTGEGRTALACSSACFIVCVVNTPCLPILYFPDPAPSGGTARTAEQAVQGANQGAGYSENYERAAQASPGVLSPTGRHGSCECSQTSCTVHCMRMYVKRRYAFSLSQLRSAWWVARHKQRRASGGPRLL
jgi:hypothetical protein